MITNCIACFAVLRDKISKVAQDINRLACFHERQTCLIELIQKISHIIVKPETTNGKMALAVLLDERD